jgi:Ca2+/Na+ antiporter
MLKCQINKLWLENITNLFCTYNLIPLEGMSLEEQMNALSRLVIIIFFILLLFSFQYSLLFLLLALLFIIILYYIQKKNMEWFKSDYRYTEHYQDTNTCNSKPAIFIAPDKNHIIYNDPSSKRFCNDVRPLDGPNGAFNNPNWMSINQKLVGEANPKTKIPPTIVAPAADLSYWKANNLVTHSAINDESQIDVYQSGYQVSTCCAPSYDCGETCRLAIPQQNNTPSVPIVTNVEMYSEDNTPDMYLQKSGNISVPYLKNTPELLVRPEGPGQVNTACGYNPSQLLEAGLPTNLPAGNCEQDPVMKQYNDNLFTQTVQPGIYARNQINEPINSNIGISFTQQHPPTTCKTDVLTGEVNYTEHDPRIIEPTIEQPNMAVQTPVNEANIYDPRFTGYGTSYRSYTDDTVGQPRFYYDDVNAVRMPNYIVRSNIDFQPFADQYGPIQPGDSGGNKFNPNIHALANDAFMTSVIEQRTDLSTRMMRKANNRQWQLRQAPITRSGGRMLGGMGSCR